MLQILDVPHDLIKQGTIGHSEARVNFIQLLIVGVEMYHAPLFNFIQFQTFPFHLQVSVVMRLILLKLCYMIRGFFHIVNDCHSGVHLQKE